MIMLSLNVKEYTFQEKLSYAAQSIFLPHKTDFLEEITCSVNVCSQNEGIETSKSHQELLTQHYKDIKMLFERTRMRHQVDFLIIEPLN